MKSTLWWLGLIFGTLSVVTLIKHGFDYGFVVPLEIVLDFYEQAMQALFGWAEPWIKEQLAALEAWFGWNPDLYPHWKHVLVLMGIYTSRMAAMFSGSTPTWLFRLLWGLVISTVAGVLTGTIALSQGSMWANFNIAAIPILAGLLYDLGGEAWWATFFRERSDTWWGYFGWFLFFYLRRTALGLGLVMVALQVPAIAELRSPGIFVFGVLMAIYAAYGVLWLGPRSVANIQSAVGGTWLQAFRRSRDAAHGLAVLATIFGAVAFLAINAGLKLAGL